MTDFRIEYRSSAPWNPQMFEVRLHGICPDDVVRRCNTGEIKGFEADSELGWWSINADNVGPMIGVDCDGVVMVYDDRALEGEDALDHTISPKDVSSGQIVEIAALVRQIIRPYVEAGAYA